MDIAQSILLGIVQGLTEFLPVSSSGHLVLFQKLFGFQEAPIFFDTLVHFATLLAVVFYLRKEIWEILTNLKKNINLIWLLILGTLPAVVFALLFKDYIENSFNSVWLLSVGFFITAALLFATKFIGNGKKDMQKINWVDSIIIGIFQAVAILPSISRSGATISSALYRGIKREDAFKFSFLLSIPAIAGAMVLQIFDFNPGNLNGGFWPNALGFVFAAVFGFLSLFILERIAQKGKLYYFAIYCFALGGAILLFVR
ncbi:MAG TPA: undecaprenyl-diphosphate phosphatase [Candidatus Staskawiczbacteria bacterium]|nr:undecaprenyl-diphosphate phosphatase [Candidatus Staskawiczbacteria bacterium]